MGRFLPVAILSPDRLFLGESRHSENQDRARLVGSANFRLRWQSFPDIQQ